MEKSTKNIYHLSRIKHIQGDIFNIQGGRLEVYNEDTDEDIEDISIYETTKNGWRSKKAIKLEVVGAEEIEITDGYTFVKLSKEQGEELLNKFKGVKVKHYETFKRDTKSIKMASLIKDPFCVG